MVRGEALRHGRRKGAAPGVPSVSDMRGAGGALTAPAEEAGPSRMDGDARPPWEGPAGAWASVAGVLWPRQPGQCPGSSHSTRVGRPRLVRSTRPVSRGAVPVQPRALARPPAAPTPGSLSAGRRHVNCSLRVVGKTWERPQESPLTSPRGPGGHMAVPSRTLDVLPGSIRAFSLDSVAGAAVGGGLGDGGLGSCGLRDGGLGSCGLGDGGLGDGGLGDGSSAACGWRGVRPPLSPRSSVAFLPLPGGER